MLGQRIMNGQCLCGGVRFEIDGGLGPVVCCHCSLCRKASGSAFAANATVPKAAFRIVEGRDLVREYLSSATGIRAFCSRCGSPIYGGDTTWPDFVRVRLGTLDGDPGQRPRAHVWVGSKSAWFEITDALEQFDGAPPVSHVLASS